MAAVLVAAAVVAGAATGFFAAAGERALYATGLWTTGGASTIAPGTFDSPAGPSATPAVPSSAAGLPAPVLDPAPRGRVLSAAKVAARLAAVDDPGRGGTLSAEVEDLTSGRVLYRHRSSSPAIPASTTKLLTATAALSLLGPDHEFTTSVVRPAARRLVLVGGGDPYLTRKAGSGYPKAASLAALARDTAAQLERAKVTSVALGYDTSLFSGPAWNPDWPDSYADQATPVSALWVDEGRSAGYSPGPRVADPAREAASVFAAELEKREVQVTAIAPARAPRRAPSFARVRSMPLAQIVERLLLASDNDAAEVLLRQAALADHRAGSTVQGVRAVRARLDRLGLAADQVRQRDGSGLSRKTRVPAEVLVDLLRLAARPDHPELRAVLTGLPVAGVEGSLRIHYTDDASRVGRGVVRAKTGTLSGVHALAGYLQTADGAEVAFAFLVDDAKNDYAAVVWLDRVSAALSRCGC